MNYEQLISKVLTTKFNLGHMMRMQKEIGMDKLSKMDNIGDEDQFEMLEIMVGMLHVIIGSPKDFTPDDIADIIPVDKMEEVSKAMEAFLGQLGNVQKNSQAE